MKIILLFGFGISGFAALIYEVAWARALSLVFGSTTYALSTMLGTFMAGLAIGGYIGGRLADRRGDLIKLFGLCEAGIGIFGLLSIPLIYALPPVYLYIYRTFHLNLTVFLSFQFLLSAAVMIIPTILMGVTFPLVSRAITDGLGEMGRKVGNAYAVNTLGAIAGSLFSGFLLIPLFGLKMTVFVAAGINLVIASVLIFLSGKSRKTIAAVWMLAFLSGGITAYSEEKTTFITFYTASRFPDVVLDAITQEGQKSYYSQLYYKEAFEGAVRLYKDKEGYLILQTGGKIEGTAKGDMPNTLLLAYLPIASHRDAQSILVIGLGTGVTLRAAKEHVEEVDLVEINSAVIEAIERYGQKGLFDGVNIYVDDARSYLFYADKKYDIITSEPSYPAEASIANLFTLEYYKIAKKRLNRGGIYCQWLPYYFFRNKDVTMMLKTFGSVFKYVYLWKVGDTLDLLMIGSEEPFPFDKDEIIKRVKILNNSEFDLKPVLSREPWQVEEIVRKTDILINTDDRPLLEFNTVRNIITGVKD